MIFKQADYDEITRAHTTTEVLGYIITLGGKPFISYNNKKVYKTKQSAMRSLNNTLKWKIESIVREKLIASGMTHDEINRDAEYLSAYKNFIAQAEANGFLQVIRLKQ